MAFKDFFTSEEWNTLQYAHFWIFQAVAGADKKIDAEERIAFHNAMANADKYSNPLAREIMSGLEFNIENVSAKFNLDERTAEEGLKEATEILDSKIDSKIAREYKKTLIAIGVIVADASGKLFRPNISKEEAQVLENVSKILKLSESALLESPTIEELVKAIEE